ncbi:MAG: acyl-CoA desaturase [Myxococcales bacterium]|nr:acyl-CoA desaturase [Myxococcales bacterium]
MQHIHFAPKGPFFAELKHRAQAALAARGLPQHGGARIIFKALVILAMLATSYIGLVFWAHTWWQALLSGFVLANSIILVGFCIMHDGGHFAFSDKKWLNRLAGRGLDLVGGNQTMWTIKHGVLHHTYTNLDAHDDDLETGGVLRLHPDQPWRPWHRFQHIYAWFSYCLLALIWAGNDIKNLVSGRIKSHKIGAFGAGNWIIFLTFKALFFTLGLVLPMMFHAWWVVVLGYVGVLGFVGLVMAIVFQLAHVVDHVAFPTPDAATGNVQDEWAIHQCKTTANFAPRNPFVHWYTGGLNRQIEHHLFTKISHVRYGAITGVVEQTCREYGVPYYVYPSVWAALKAHARQLAAFAKRPGTVDAAAPTGAMSIAN